MSFEFEATLIATSEQCTEHRCFHLHAVVRVTECAVNPGKQCSHNLCWMTWDAANYNDGCTMCSFDINRTWSWLLQTRGFSCSPAARTELASPLPKAVSWSKLSRPIPQTNGTHNHGLRDVKAPSAAAVHFTIEDQSLFVPLLLFLLLLFSLLLSSSSPRVVWGDRVGEW